MKKFLTAMLCAADGTVTLTHDAKISLSDELKILSPISGNVVATVTKL